MLFLLDQCLSISNHDMIHVTIMDQFSFQLNAFRNICGGVVKVWVQAA